MDIKDPNSRQVGGEHYQNGKYQHWDMCHDAGLGYFEGQITLYIARWRDKGGVEDLEKALHFLEKLMTLSDSYVQGRANLVLQYMTKKNGGLTLPIETHSWTAVMREINNRFCEAYGMVDTERGVSYRILTWLNYFDLHAAHLMLHRYVEIKKQEATTSQE